MRYQFNIQLQGKVSQEINHSQLKRCHSKQSYDCCGQLHLKVQQILFFNRIQLSEKIKQLPQSISQVKYVRIDMQTNHISLKDYNMNRQKPGTEEFKLNQIPFLQLLGYNQHLYLNNLLLYQYPQLQLNAQALVVKVKEEEIIKEEFIQVKQENISQSEQEQCIVGLDSKKRKYYIYPGETKNYYKNIGQKLSQFIQQNFSDTLAFEDQHIQQFLRIKNQKYNRNHLESFLQSKKARQIAKQFFGNFLWSSQFLEVNKSEIDLYFRHNPKILKKKISKQ